MCSLLVHMCKLAERFTSNERQLLVLNVPSSELCILLQCCITLDEGRDHATFKSMCHLDTSGLQDWWCTVNWYPKILHPYK